MDFQIVNANKVGFTINDELRSRVNKPLAGEQQGISVVSFFSDYKHPLVGVGTEIKFILVKGEEVTEVALASFASTFYFTTITTLTLGINDHAVACLKKCHDLAQAHAFGMFSYLCAKNDLPRPAMEMTPYQNYKDHILNFLKENELPLE